MMWSGKWIWTAPPSELPAGGHVGYLRRRFWIDTVPDVVASRVTAGDRSWSVLRTSVCDAWSSSPTFVTPTAWPGVCRLLMGNCRSSSVRTVAGLGPGPAPHLTCRGGDSVWTQPPPGPLLTAAMQLSMMRGVWCG